MLRRLVGRIFGAGSARAAAEVPPPPPPKPNAAAAAPTAANTYNHSTNLEDAVTEPQPGRYNHSVSLDDEINEAMRQLEAGAAQAKPLTEMASMEVESIVEEKSAQEIDELASAYHKGERGVAMDKIKAVALWKVAAEMGNVNAQYSYAMSLKAGEGTEDGKPRHLDAARQLIPLAERGHPWAQFAVAKSLLNGEGVKVNEEEALNLFKISAQNGVAPALASIGDMYAAGKGTGGVADEKVACEWYTKAAEAGDPKAMFELGTRYTQGKGVETDWGKGFEYNMRAATAPVTETGSGRTGLPQAHFNVANQYFLGRGVGQDYAAAASHYETAANAGFVWAMVNLGNMYNEGRGVKEDKAAAEWWYSKAAPHNENARALLKDLLEAAEAPPAKDQGEAAGAGSSKE